MTLGAGQFCTNPGLVLALDGPELETFLQSAGALVGAAPASTMLSRSILKNYLGGIDTLAGSADVHTVAFGPGGDDSQGRAALFATSADTFQSNHALRAEVFGAASLIVRCPDAKVLYELINDLEGQLTISVHAVESDYAAAQELMPVLERKAGRIVFNGFGTGVEVSRAMVHGGPYPATSDNRFTSVGSLAIRRFLRPVCYQDVPHGLLPEMLRGEASKPI
jgi:alpha-ketoglutaric semialdehyde dehydrogenase